MQSSFEIWGQNLDVGYQILCCSIWHDANCLHSSAYSHLINEDFPQSTIFKKNAAVKSRTAQKLVAGAEASRCMQSWQYAGKEQADNIQEEAFWGLRIVQEHRELFRSHFWYQEELLWEDLQELATTCTVTRAAPSKRQIAINNCLPASYYFSLVCKIYATVEANEFFFFFNAILCMMHPRTDSLMAMRNNGGSHPYPLWLTNISKMLSSSSALHHKDIIRLRYKELMLPIMKFHIIFIPVGNEAI